MESGDRIHQRDEPEKSLQSRVAELKETITPGLDILRERAGSKGGEPVNVSRQAREAFEIVCANALSGNLKALEQLQSIASKLVSKAGSLDEFIAASNPHAARSGQRPRISGKRRRSSRKLENAVPERPAVPVDIEFPVEPIRGSEVVEFLNARDMFLRTRADYERKRAGLLYKLQMLCSLEDLGSDPIYTLRLSSDGDTIIIKDFSGTPSEVVIDRR